MNWIFGTAAITNQQLVHRLWASAAILDNVGSIRLKNYAHLNFGESEVGTQV